LPQIPHFSSERQVPEREDNVNATFLDRKFILANSVQIEDEKFGCPLNFERFPHNLPPKTSENTVVSPQQVLEAHTRNDLLLFEASATERRILAVERQHPNFRLENSVCVHKIY
jgi:hypothetical protein